MVGAVAILIGKEFHVVIVRGKKLYFRAFVLHWYVMQHIWCERVGGRGQGVRYLYVGTITRLFVIL